MDICHVKKAELVTKHQKYKGRVVLPSDIVKDDSDSYAVFTEQGSSASQMTAAKVVDIISILLGCDGQAADAVSASTQVKMEDAHKLVKIPKSECPDMWIRLPRHKWPKSCPVWKTQSFFFSGICTVIFCLDCCGKGDLKILLQHGWEKVSKWECLFRHHEKSYFYLCTWMAPKVAGKKHNIDPVWKVLNKEVDLREPTSIFPSCILGMYSTTL